MTKEFAGVYILDIPYHADRMYDYYIPAELDGIVAVGSIVCVPYGNGNRKMSALVTEIKGETKLENLKPIIDVISPEPYLDGKAIELCFFMKERTLCTVGDAVRAILPAAAISKSGDYYLPVAADEAAIPESLSVKASFVYSFICAHGRVSLSRLKSEYGAETDQLIASLVKLKLIKKETEFKSPSGNKFVTFASLAIPVDEANAMASGDPDAPTKLRSPAHGRILAALIETDRMATDKLCETAEATTAQINALAKKGLVTLEREIDIRNPYAIDPDTVHAPEAIALSEEQHRAYVTLSELFLAPEAKAALLHGVTGSGKTKVIMSMIDLALEQKKDVIVLVPEISLTPQMVGIFLKQYGAKVAVMHSSLSAGERYDAWHRARTGEANIIIGTRSAVFAPVKNLGMIVIDEEQEHTYKSDTSPKYTAHDIARFRCAADGALLLLSSATPSVTSYYKTETGAYTLVELTERYGNAKLPEVVVADMRSELREGNVSPVGSVLSEKLTEALANKEQSVIFLNRRGYNSFISCRSCGEAIKCPNCSVSLTYHTKRFLGDDNGEGYLKRRMESGLMKCHYCGYTARVPEKCPTCQSEHFLFAGYGTQKAEEELTRLVPDGRIVRMDMDTTQTKFSHEALLGTFRRGEADVLLGTQMVTKGHDFPNVTLVGVMNADSSLYLEDYRASERTFDMLTQVIGRAGRAEKPGVAVIQTMNPDSEVIELAARQDYKTFYQREIRLRKALVFPPFCDIVLLTLTSKDEALLGSASVRLSERMRELLRQDFSDVKAIVFGPFEAPIYKIQKTCRMRMVVKCKLTKRTRAFIGELLAEFGKNGGKRLTLQADFNPSSL